jgi:hypothetical protein
LNALPHPTPSDNNAYWPKAVETFEDINMLALSIIAALSPDYKGNNPMMAGVLGFDDIANSATAGTRITRIIGLRGASSGELQMLGGLNFVNSFRPGRTS